MFKKTMPLSDLKRDINDSLGELREDDALQLSRSAKGS